MRLKNEQKIETVDTETGEIITIVSAKEYSTKVESDRFYMTFIDYIAPLYKLKSENARKILAWMCSHAEYNTGIVSLTTADRQQMAEEIDICVNTITNNLASLKKLNLISGDKGRFQINPQIFWKGDTKTRKQLLDNKELTIKFSIE